MEDANTKAAKSNYIQLSYYRRECISVKQTGRLLFLRFFPFYKELQLSLSPAFTFPYAQMHKGEKP